MPLERKTYGSSGNLIETQTLSLIKEEEKVSEELIESTPLIENSLHIDEYMDLEFDEVIDKRNNELISEDKIENFVKKRSLNKAFQSHGNLLGLLDEQE